MDIKKEVLLLLKKQQEYINMINLDKYRFENGYYNATAYMNDYNEAHGTNRKMIKFVNTHGIKVYMADMVILMNSLTKSKSYNKNNIKLSKFGHDGYTSFIPELFAKYVCWANKSFERQAFDFLIKNGYRFQTDEGELIDFVSKNYNRYFGEKLDVLALHREVDLCRFTPKIKTFKKEDIIRMNISMITSGVDFAARKEILYTNFI